MKDNVFAILMAAIFLLAAGVFLCGQVYELAAMFAVLSPVAFLIFQAEKY